MIESVLDEVKISPYPTSQTLWLGPVGFARFCGVRIAVVIVVAMASPAAAGSQSNPAFLGISMQQGFGGVTVDTVTKDSPAAEPNGLKQGDLIVQINGARIQNGNEATAAITANHPGDIIQIDVRRGSGLVHVS